MFGALLGDTLLHFLAICFCCFIVLFFTLITTVVISFLMDAFAVPSVFFRLALFLFFLYILYILILLIDILTVLVSVASFACFLVLKFGSGIVM